MTIQVPHPFPQSATPFGERLAAAVLSKKNPVCVGLDPRAASLPDSLRPATSASLEQTAQAIQAYCFEVIDTVCDLVPVVKPQAAFFEELGPPGVLALQQVVLRAKARDLLVVMDAKRGDIGSTASAYAATYLGKSPELSASPEDSQARAPFPCDALTVNPFLGIDTLEPFLKRCERVAAGLFVLVKTSNPGSGFLQDIVDQQGTVSEKIAHEVQALTHTTLGPSGYGSIGAVVGATFPTQLAAMRERMPNAWLLIPGYGAQGGSASDVRHGLDSRGLGAIVNSSRGILFAYEQARFAAADWRHSVRQATFAMIDDLCG